MSILQCRSRSSQNISLGAMMNTPSLPCAGDGAACAWRDKGGGATGVRQQQQKQKQQQQRQRRQEQQQQHQRAQNHCFIFELKELDRSRRQEPVDKGKIKWKEITPNKQASVI
ncbi:unnamed protein product [Pleuronectes platessa]|uniref:Uncharacterized protein n=1 Tax=Pleuronectes platessa TaxID=8262 RepID=A0A9N7U4Z6_PLEPL|nr:unnamed protein product [Pleuronectes platessa]